MKDTKSGELSSKLVSNHTSLTSNLKHNLLAYMSNITQKELADKSGISFDTLKNLLYQNPKDCKLSTAASLAHALNLTIDELVGADTLSEEDESCIRMFRSMPEHYQYFVRWFICRQYPATAKPEKLSLSWTWMNTQMGHFTFPATYILSTSLTFRQT